MATNPNVSQGTLNRLIASVIWTDFPQLNVTAPYLGEEGIHLAFEGESTVFINTMTGAVTSQEPYLVVNVTMNLLKTQPLANAYKQQWETSSQLGECTVRPDSSTMSPWDFENCAIQSVRELSLNGRDAGYVVTIKGYYLINSDLWSQ
jgi:hypothetical protein